MRATHVEFPWSTRSPSTSGYGLPKSLFQSKPLSRNAFQISFEPGAELSLASLLVGQVEKIRSDQAGASIAKCLDRCS